MVGTRFEFGGTGIFHALNVLENCEMSLQDEMDYDWATTMLERDLQVPEILAPGNKTKTRSYFTQEGMDAFKEEIDVLYNLFQNYAEGAGLGELEEIIKDIRPEDIIYRDEYQILTKEE